MRLMHLEAYVLVLRRNLECGDKRTVIGIDDRGLLLARRVAAVCGRRLSGAPQRGAIQNR